MKVMLVGLLKSISVLPFFLSVIILHTYPCTWISKPAVSLMPANLTRTENAKFASSIRLKWCQAVPDFFTQKPK